MPVPVFRRVDSIVDREELLPIVVEYMCWNAAEIEKSFGISVPALIGMPVPDYVASTLHKSCGDAPPRGAFYLVDYDGALAAMGGMRWVREGVGEVKRFYVRPAYRGKRLGETILHRVISDARAFGYRRMLLDSGPFMTAAHRLYEANGFTYCDPYAETECPPALHGNWRFMQRGL